MSSEYRYSDDIPTKQVVGNNSSEFHISSEIHRNFPTEFRGNKLPRKFRGPMFVGKVLGIYRGRASSGYLLGRSSIDAFLDIYSSIDRNIPRDIFLGIYRGTSCSEYSEGNVPRYIPREKFLGIFRGTCPSQGHLNLPVFASGCR
ncbi:hypothetical protein F2Q69_00038721 [Brassica cretica]|uniref:Uncharacterized protein n=1 Tax=Brassica cretica TaxID=69181 RepID=A0A8S9SDT8_BRACR|nr:hypothetical protein F2Q69_00038721 [Brassica cretica]